MRNTEVFAFGILVLFSLILSLCVGVGVRGVCVGGLCVWTCVMFFLLFLFKTKMKSLVLFDAIWKYTGMHVINIYC